MFKVHIKGPTGLLQGSYRARQGFYRARHGFFRFDNPETPKPIYQPRGSPPVLPEMLRNDQTDLKKRSGTVNLHHLCIFGLVLFIYLRNRAGS